MVTREISDQELEGFLADVGISDSLRPEVGQMLPPPPLPDNLIIEPREANKRRLLWLALGFAGTFFLGLLIGVLVTLPMKKPYKLQLVEIQKQIDTLSEKISSYDDITRPKYELIEPLIAPSAFDSAA